MAYVTALLKSKLKSLEEDSILLFRFCDSQQGVKNAHEKIFTNLESTKHTFVMPLAPSKHIHMPG